MYLPFVESMAPILLSGCTVRCLPSLCSSSHSWSMSRFNCASLDSSSYCFIFFLSWCPCNQTKSGSMSISFISPLHAEMLSALGAVMCFGIRVSFTLLRASSLSHIYLRPYAPKCFIIKKVACIPSSLALEDVASFVVVYLCFIMWFH